MDEIGLRDNLIIGLNKQHRTMEKFIIDLVYEQMHYSGLVNTRKVGEHLLYSIKLESQNQELTFDISANSCGDGKFEWCYSGGWDESVDFDPELLLAIGEAIEKHRIGSKII